MADGEKTVIRAEHLSDTVPAGKESKKESKASEKAGLAPPDPNIAKDSKSFLKL